MFNQATVALLCDARRRMEYISNTEDFGKKKKKRYKTNYKTARQSAACSKGKHSLCSMNTCTCQCAWHKAGK